TRPDATPVDARATTTDAVPSRWTWPRPRADVSSSAWPHPALGDHRLDCLVPLFCHAAFPHVRECQDSAETGVKHHPKLCKESAEPLCQGSAGSIHDVRQV